MADGSAYTNLLGINSSDNALVGYGLYSRGTGGTYIYGGDAVGIRSKGGFNITSATAGLSAREYGVNKVLWSGAYGMDSSQTITFSEAVSAQPHGVVLVFSSYSDSTARNYGWVQRFVPKHHTSSHNGTGVVCFGFNSTANQFFNKYLYVYDTKVVGHDNNWSDTTTNCGITRTNSGAVLRYAIGV